MEKLKMETTGIVEGNFDKIRALFPHCITEIKGKDSKIRHAVDFDKLRAELGDDMVEGQRERYQFTWPQKSVAAALANTPTKMTLRPDRDSSVDFDNTENLYIEGDNLEVLKVLRETYLGRVKMIYIDPPYNTGKDFVYKDRRYLSQKEMDEKEGKFDEYGNLLFTNSDSNGRFHTDWLNFIYPRLKVARDLLTDDGVIFLSIGDTELNNLGKICSEIFGESNFIAKLTIITGANQAGDGVLVQKNVEYVLVYAKNISNAIINRIDKTSESWRNLNDAPTPLVTRPDMGYTLYYNPTTEDIIPRYDYDRSQLDSNDESKIYQDDIELISLGYVPVRPGKRNGSLHRWRWGFETFTERKSEVKMFPSKDSFIPKFLQGGFNPPKNYHNFSGGASDLKSLFGDNVPFDYPKGLAFIKYLIQIGASEDSVILDFFSGSGTTAHAVMTLNAEDGGHRKFIMVQLAEPTPEDSEARKAGYENICQIGEERIRRAGKKIKKEAGEHGKDLDIGFRVLKLDTSNMKDVFYTPAAVTQKTIDDMLDNVKEGRSDEDLLFQVMLQNNIPLSANIEKITVNGHTTYVVAEGALIATFDRTLDDETLVQLAKMEPLKFVMREPEERDGVNPDNLIDNFEQKFELYSPNTQRSIL